MIFRRSRPNLSRINARLRRLLAEWIAMHHEECRYDPEGFCQAHYLEQDCIVRRTREALTNGGPN